MPVPDWSETRVELRDRLASLADGEGLVLAEPDPVQPDAPRRGLFRRRPRPLAGRYVQFVRLDDELVCQCIGPGYAEVDAGAEQALLRQGWRAPDDPGVRSENYEARLPIGEAAAAADLAIAALQVLGVSPEDLRWTVVTG